MLKKHIVLFESKHHGWIAYSTTGSDAKRILSVNKKYDVFYIFECDLLKEYPYIMKLKAPLHLCTFKTPILEDKKYAKDNCEFHALTYLSSRRSIAVNYIWLFFFL